MGSESVQQKGAEFHYVLRSLWPVNPKNAPETATERTGLQAVVDHPDSNYYAEESLWVDAVTSQPCTPIERRFQVALSAITHIRQPAKAISKLGM